MAKNWLGTDAGSTTLEEGLKRFGHPSFRPGQEELMQATQDGQDALGVLSTGYGKSVCFQVPALLQEKGKPTLVVLPSSL